MRTKHSVSASITERSAGAILAVVCLAGVSACSSVLMNKPVSKNSDGWGLTLSEAKQGPDEYVGEGGILLAPGEGQSLIWALVTVRNQSTQEQTFAYDTCLLSGPGQAFHPLVVDRHAQAEFNQPADKSESIEPGQERTRILVFPYAKGRRPTALSCGDLALAFPAAR